ncbi:MAG: hypothetical protein JOZ43_02240 [Acidobacteriales bacterium]|nr:hypothetical protein [Terriglobales bacterium]
MEVDLKYYVDRVNAQLAKGKTILAVFSGCYEACFHKPCASDMVKIDALRWERAVQMGHGPIVPKYVSWCFDDEDAARAFAFQEAGRRFLHQK